MPSGNLTERQARWFASIRASLERDTGRTMAEWVEIARTCPETAHRARLKWFKDSHGLLQNRASQVLSEAFPPLVGWGTPEALVDSLWGDPNSRAIFESLDALASALPGTIRTARKSYTAWSRKVQFAAARPKGGVVILGLAIAVDAGPGLEVPKSESWSERLRSRITIGTPADVGSDLKGMLRLAWENS